MKKILLAALVCVVGAFSGWTQCPSPELAPWLESFSAGANPPCWTQSATSGGPWTYTGTPDYGATGGTNSGYPIVDHTAGVANNYVWMDFSGTDAGVILTTPEIDVTALTVPELAFWTISHNNDGSVTPYNDLNVEASDGLGGWTLVTTLTGETGPTWVQNLFDVSAYVYGANLVQLRFRAESGGAGSDFNNDLLIDDVEIREQPTCPQPSGIVVSNITGTTADVVFTDNAGAAEWEVEYGLSGYTPGTGTSVFVAGTSTN